MMTWKMIMTRALRQSDPTVLLPDAVNQRI